MIPYFWPRLYDGEYGYYDGESINVDNEKNDNDGDDDDGDDDDNDGDDDDSDDDDGNDIISINHHNCMQMPWPACTNALGRLQQQYSYLFFFDVPPILLQGYPDLTQRSPQCLPKVYPKVNNILDLQYGGAIAPTKHPHLGHKVSEIFPNPSSGKTGPLIERLSCTSANQEMGGGLGVVHCNRDYLDG